MLSTLESILAAPLEAALSGQAKVLVGPGQALGKTADPAVLLLARRWVSPSPGTPADKMEARGAVFFTQYLGLEAKPEEGPKAFTLPLETQGELAEVHVTPGRLLKAGDDYTLQERTVLCAQTPALPVWAQVRGAQARGYSEKLPWQAELEIYTVAASAEGNDALLKTSLAVVLRVLAERDFVNITLPDAPELTLRLRQPQLVLMETERLENPLITDKKGVRTVSKLLVQATLELGLILGEMEKKPRIKRFAYGPS